MAENTGLIFMDNIIKIAFTGTQSSGKTTLTDELLKLLPNSIKVGSVARQSPFKELNENTTYQNQMWIISNRIQLEIEASINKPQYIICERSCIDDYAYFYRKYEKEQREKHETNIFAESCYNIQTEIARNWTSTYNYLFYLEPLSLVNDNVRSNNKEYQLEIDSIIRESLYGIKHYKINVDTIENRTKRIMDIINGKCKEDEEYE